MLRVSQWYSLAEGLSPEFKKVCRLGADLQKKYNRIDMSLKAGVFYPGLLRELLTDRLVLITELLNIVQNRGDIEDTEKMDHLVSDIESQFQLLDVERAKLAMAFQSKNYGEVDLVMFDTDKLVRSYVYQPMLDAKLASYKDFAQKVVSRLSGRRGISAKLERPPTTSKRRPFKTTETIDL